MKTCSKCNIEKSIEDYPKVGKKCKLCLKEYRAQWALDNKQKLVEYGKEWREKNKDHLLESKRRYYYDNKDEILTKHKKYRSENKETLDKKKKEYNKENKELINRIKKNWRDRNKDYHNNYMKDRLENDEIFRLKFYIRNSIRSSFKNKGIRKNLKTQEILGCSFEEFKIHLESMFEPWMSWENYGKYNGELNYGWDIDHIIPMVTASSEEEVIKLNYFNNLQPLCSYINRVVKRGNL